MASISIEKLRKGLSPYLPPITIEPLVKLIYDHQISIRITKERSTKLGDYRPPFNGKGHQISINGTLNSYQFLVTLLHEIAHCFTFIQFKNSVPPHGQEWKNQFKIMLEPFIKHHIFPHDIELALQKHLKSVKASSCSDPHLLMVLKSYDERSEDHPFVHLESLPIHSKFEFRDKIYEKGEKRRTRIVCTEQSSGKQFLFHPIAEVIPIFAP
jgi:SprT protein